jgi:hypothetical protein
MSINRFRNWLSYRLEGLSERIHDLSCKARAPIPPIPFGECDEITKGLLRESARMGEDICKIRTNPLFRPLDPSIGVAVRHVTYERDMGEVKTANSKSKLATAKRRPTEKPKRKRPKS